MVKGKESHYPAIIPPKQGRYISHEMNNKSFLNFRTNYGRMNNKSFPNSGTNSSHQGNCASAEWELKHESDKLNKRGKEKKTQPNNSISWFKLTFDIHTHNWISEINIWMKELTCCKSKPVCVINLPVFNKFSIAVPICFEEFLSITFLISFTASLHNQ